MTSPSSIKLFFKIALVFSLIFSHLNHALAYDVCSRVALINFQEVLVDASSTQKGEGLRFFLEKDETAKKYLERYQEGQKVHTGSVIFGSLATILTLTGLLLSKEKSQRQTLVGVGGSLLLLNFFVSKTMANKNETNLNKAIEEYNKRNLPRIYFDEDLSPQSPSSSSLNQKFLKNYAFHNKKFPAIMPLSIAITLSF